MTLKIALLALTAAGTVTAGGVTYASVSGSNPAPKQQSAAKHVPAKPSAAAPNAPHAHDVPTCLPNGKLPNGKLPAGRIPGAKAPQAPDAKAPQGTLPKAPGANVPSANVPSDKLPQNKLPDQPTTPQVPHASNAPQTLPSCLPKGKHPKNMAGASKASNPAKPELPKAGSLSCSKVPAAVTLGRSFERTVTLPRGMRYSTTRTASVTFESRKVCTITQKWVGAGGQWLSVQRLKAAKDMSPEQFRQALRLPTLTRTTLNGTDALESPLGTSALWVGKDGFGVYLSASPSFKGQLAPVVAQLQQLR